MKKLGMIAPVALLLLATACNDDDGGSGSGNGNGNGGDLTEDQQAAVDQLLAGEDELGLVFDEGCVYDRAGELSDEDAAALAEAGPEGGAELSPEGQALTLELFDCIDNDALVELFISEMESEGQSFDEECVRDAFEDVDLGAMFAASESGVQVGDDPESAEALQAVLACVSLGG